MAQVFAPRANTLVKVSFVGAALGLLAIIAIWMFFTRSPFVRQVGLENAPEQPVQFSHQLHAGQGIQCQYCHNGVGESAYANVPATETCMTCHSQIKTGSALLQPVRDSWESGLPIKWNKVHDVPEFVYFNHSVHVNNGVGCSSCHGNVAQIAYPMYKVEPMYMAWCLNCHRHPEQFVRPQSEIYNTAWEPPANQLQVGAQLVEEYGIKKDNLTNCAICHR